MEAAVASCGKLNFASWTVPNGEANAAFRARSTMGSRAITAGRSWRPISPVSSINIRMPRPKGASRPPFGLLRDATIPACPRPCKTQPIFPPAQGDVMAQMRQIFYGRRKLAMVLTGSGSPQCCRRRCTVGPPWRPDLPGRRRADHGAHARKSSSRDPAERRYRYGSRIRHHIFTPCSARYFSAPGCHGIGEFLIDWFSRAMFFASACTAASSSRFSMKVLTMS